VSIYQVVVYPHLVHMLGDPKMIRDVRKWIVPLAHGTVLEIGAVAGANFAHYNCRRHDSTIILRSVSIRPEHLSDQNFDHDYYFKLPLEREWDAHSLGRRSIARHARYRAVPRSNRIRPTANTANRSATIQYSRTASLRAMATLAMLTLSLNWTRAFEGEVRSGAMPQPPTATFNRCQAGILSRKLGV
jgi:hypothetical protein